MTSPLARPSLPARPSPLPLLAFGITLLAGAVEFSNQPGAGETHRPTTTTFREKRVPNPQEHQNEEP
jgi:hypothetical protein